jgi:hypothetical protein
MCSSLAWKPGRTIADRNRFGREVKTLPSDPWFNPRVIYPSGNLRLYPSSILSPRSYELCMVEIPAMWEPAVPRGTATAPSACGCAQGSPPTRRPQEMIISLYASGMTLRDIQQHLALTTGTELSMRRPPKSWISLPSR